MKLTTNRDIYKFFIKDLEIRPPANPKVNDSHTVALNDENGFPKFVMQMTVHERKNLAERLLEGSTFQVVEVVELPKRPEVTSRPSGGEVVDDA